MSHLATALARLRALSYGVPFCAFACAAPTSPPGDGVLARAIAPPAGDHPYLNLAWTADSDQDRAQFGGRVATAGDVNGDGYDDVLVGSSLYDDGDGKAFLYLGSANGLTQPPAWTEQADQSNASFGSALASAGDVDGDGYGDVIVGAGAYSNGQSSEGRAFLYRGAPAGLDTAASWTAESDQASAWFGGHVESAGDVNGDGYGDVVVGAERYDNGELDEGGAFLFLGSASGLSATAAWSAESDQVSSKFGTALAAGDVNGDGYDDLLVGASAYDNGETDEGQVRLYMGSPSGLAATPAWTAESDQEGAAFGESVATAGDINGDGFDDVLVGARFFDDGEVDEGRASLYLGSASGLASAPAWTGTSDQPDAWYGHKVAFVGDVNVDGFDDVVVGGFHYDDGELDEGAAFLYLGAATGLDAVSSWMATSDAVDGRFGAALAGAGDVNGDGSADVVVGANGFDDLAGRVYVFHGGCPGESGDADGDFVEDACDLCPGADDRTFDQDRDQHCALKVGGVVQDCDDAQPQTYLGATELCDGQDNACTGSVPAEEIDHDGDGHWVCEGDVDDFDPILTLAWTNGSGTVAEVGWVVSAVGDVDGDGYDDAVVGHREHGLEAGAAYLYLGSGAGLGTIPAWSAFGSAGDDGGAWFASAIAGGDVNGDGFSDVLLGAPSSTGTSGRAYLYLGSAAGLLATPAWTAGPIPGYFGAAVKVDDFNGDGFGDAVVAATTFDGGEIAEGKMFGYLGSAAGLELAPSWTAEEDGPVGFLGGTLATGDVNGDGYADLLAGAIFFDDTGKVFLYFGSASGLSTVAGWSDFGEEDSDFGASVALGDVNGDGFADVIVGVRNDGSVVELEGSVRVYLGSAAGPESEPSWSFSSGQAGASLGTVATGGDVNGDGYTDLVVGAPGFENGQIGEGRTWLFLGSSLGLEATPAWSAEPDQDGAGFGAFLAMAGDVNGDGFGDVWVSAPDWDSVEVDRGRAYLFLGRARCVDGPDTDGDGFGDACDACPGADDAVADGDGDGVCSVFDCDDADPAVYPGAPERCNGLDDACAGNLPADEVDGDADGYLACAECDDADPTVFPGALELCDGLDNRCVGSVPVDEVDEDGDGALACADCDDQEAGMSPWVAEICGDGLDNDCDGSDAKCPAPGGGGCGGGCATGPGPAAPPVGWAVALALVWASRRPPSRPAAARRTRPVHGLPPDARVEEHSRPQDRACAGAGERSAPGGGGRAACRRCYGRW